MDARILKMLKDDAAKDNPMGRFNQKVLDLYYNLITALPNATEWHLSRHDAHGLYFTIHFTNNEIEEEVHVIEDPESDDDSDYDEKTYGYDGKYYDTMSDLMDAVL